MCAVVWVCASFAWEVGVCFVLRCLHEPFLLYSIPILEAVHDSNFQQFSFHLSINKKDTLNAFLYFIKRIVHITL